MNVRLKQDYTTYNFTKEEDANLEQGQTFTVVGNYNEHGDNTVTDQNGSYIIPSNLLEYVGEDEPDGI